MRAGERVDSRHGQTDQTDPNGKGAASTNYAWGWEANIAVRIDSEAPGQSRFPALAIAAALSLPNVGVAEEAVSLMRAAKATGLAAGVGDADKQYWANSLVERLHDPAFNEGFTPSTDYRIDRLGVQGGDHGAKYIEGAAYCPGTPSRFVMPRKTSRTDCSTKKPTGLESRHAKRSSSIKTRSPTRADEPCCDARPSDQAPPSPALSANS